MIPVHADVARHGAEDERSRHLEIEHAFASLGFERRDHRVTHPKSVLREVKLHIPALAGDVAPALWREPEDEPAELTERDLIGRALEVVMVLEAGALEDLDIVDLAVLQSLHPLIDERETEERQPTVGPPVVEEGLTQALPGFSEAQLLVFRGEGRRAGFEQCYHSSVGLQIGHRGRAASRRGRVNRIMLASHEGGQEREQSKQAKGFAREQLSHFFTSSVGS